MASTVIVGRVAVQVYPDTSKFREKLKVDLEAAERNAPKVEIPASIDTDGLVAELEKTQRDLARRAAGDAVEIDVKVNTDELHTARRALEDIDKTLQRAADRHPNLDLDDAFNTQQAITGLHDLEHALAKVERQEDRLQGLDKKLKNLYGIKLTDALGNLDNETADALRLQKVMEDLERETNKAADASQKLKHDLNKIEFNKNFRQQMTETDSFLAEIDEEIGRLDELNDIDISLEIQGMSKAERKIEHLREQMESLQAKLTPDLPEEERRNVIRKIHNLADDIEDELDNLKAEIEPNMGYLMMKKVMARLAILTRDRIVSIIPKVNHGALVTAQATLTTLTALGGGRLAGSVLDDVFNAFKNMDKNIPRLALISEGIAGIAGWAASASANLFSLSSSLAQIGPAALALPGIFGALAIGLATTFMGFKDFNKVLPEVGKQWTDLQNVVSRNFWAEARQPFVEMTQVIMPQMREGFAIAGKEIGAFWGQFATDMADSLTKGGKLREMFKDLGDSTSIARGATKEMSDIIVRLGEKGTGLLPRMATWFVDITERFDTFLAKADKSGQLDQWIETGIANLKLLGQVVYETGSILGGLGQAAQKAGGSTLASLAKTLGDIADKVHSPEFQKDLVGVLKAAGTAMDNIAKYAGPGMDKFFDSFSQTLTKVLPIAGETIGKVLGGIADALAQPAFQNGLIDLFLGIRAGVEGLLPYLPSLSDALGAVLTTIGNMAGTFLPTIGLILGTLADVFVLLAPSINEMVGLLGGAFADLIKELAPVLLDLAEALAPVLVALGTSFAQSLQIATPYIAAIAKELGEGLLQALEKIAPILPDIVENLFPQLLTVVQQIVPQIPALVDGFLQMVDVLVKTSLIADLGKLAGSLLQLVADDVLPVLVEHLPKLADSMSMFAGALEKTVTVIDGFDIMGDLFDVVMNWNPASLMEAMGKIGADIMYSLVKGFGGGETIEKFLLWLTASIPLWKGPPSTDATLLTPAGRSIMNSLIQGFKDVDVQGALRSLTWHIPDAFNFPDGFLKGAGEGLINGFVGGLWGSFHLVSEALGWLTKQLPEWKGPPSKDKVLLEGAGASIIDGFVSGLESRYDAVRDSLSGLSDEVGRTQFQAPSIEAAKLSSTVSRSLSDETGSAAGAGAGATAPIHLTVESKSDNTKNDVEDALFELRNYRRGGR